MLAWLHPHLRYAAISACHNEERDGLLGIYPLMARFYLGQGWAVPISPRGPDWCQTFSLSLANTAD
jgi:hypothetical protein